MARRGTGSSPGSSGGPSMIDGVPRPPVSAGTVTMWSSSTRPARRSAPATPHSLTREEVFVVLEGTASVRIAGSDGQAEAGDAIVVPAGVEFELTNASATLLRLVCCLPVGGQGVIGDGAPFTPPWAE